MDNCKTCNKEFKKRLCWQMNCPNCIKRMKIKSIKSQLKKAGLTLDEAIKQGIVIIK